MATIMQDPRLGSGSGTARRTTPEVVVWEADGRPLPGMGYGTRLAQALRTVSTGVAVVPYRRRPLTEEELAAPVHILSGGETSSFSRDAVTRRARADLTGILQRAWHGDVTVIGVCLGAQLLARAINPRLPLSTPRDGMEAGLCPVSGQDGISLVPQLHYEQIHPAFAETDGVEITHTNAHTPVQGFRWGTQVLGYQFHAEWSPRDLRTALRRHRSLLAARHADPRGARASLAAGAVSWSPRLLEDLVLAPAAAALASVGVTAA